MIAQEKTERVSAEPSIESELFLGTGRALPERVVSNTVFAKRLDTSDEWVRTRTGIRERRIARSWETTSQFAVQAAQQALGAAQVQPEDIDLIVLSTTTPDMRFPATANFVQWELGAANAYAYDISVACSGFVFALASAHAQIQAGMAQTALVIASEVYSSIVDFEDRNTCLLFGDGAGAVVVKNCRLPIADCRLKDGSAGKLPSRRLACEPLRHHVEGSLPAFGREAPAEPPWERASVAGRGERGAPYDGHVQASLQRGILSVVLHSDPSQLDVLTCEGAGTAGRNALRAAHSGTIRMDGKSVFRLAVKALSRACREALDKAGCDISDVACVIPHQANIRIIEKVAQSLGCGKEKFMVNLERYGNTSSASVPIALDEAVRSKRVGPGDLVVLAAAGAGFSSGAIVVRL